ncbi:uncharacterized protein DUF4956 [Salinibacterium amurskyense]|uniref:Uncharacterized protein DUF4956 n=1 Tax=Salinibacterium amurskyense TaxID=205941 RepID=A0A2M9D3H7_9MICO|nr:DUF4956 domain-containing protein [Salinibacterium amurskyense]PJJ78558.1 uncharacterized protein DUF4956 [Salinibacterium amurskyense]RLQ80645.1 DUF4956 domain-containing protein [Salinibacterium amurskyense]GHD83021.1 DUF4956 domain-containing protein [Salinibacterium amurskyense]
MSQLTMIALDLVAVGLLTFALYFARHRRRDLLVAYLIVNVGVMAVTVMLADSAVGVGLGLGLFGVLSIIRLRSSEIAQHEVAYYFASLALGLIAGLGAAGFASESTSLVSVYVAPALMAMILLVMTFGDHPRLFRAYRQQTVTLDAAIADEPTLRVRLENLLGARVHSLTVSKLDLVNDTTVVDVRYRLVEGARSARNTATAAPTAAASGAHDNLEAAQR